MINDLRERIESKFIPEPNSGCFLWFGNLNDNDYAVLSITLSPRVKRFRRAHRLYYELEKGPIEKGLVLDHKCRMRCCVNPDHLEPVTNGVNVLRGTGPSAQAALKTHCPEGHPYEGDNLFFTKAKTRRCRICDRFYALRWHHNNKERSNEKRRRNALKVKQNV